jgi:hypothetical protein
VLCCAVLCCAVLCCAVPCCAVLCRAVLYHAVLQPCTLHYRCRRRWRVADKASVGTSRQQSQHFCSTVGVLLGPSLGLQTAHTHTHTHTLTHRAGAACTAMVALMRLLVPIPSLIVACQIPSSPPLAAAGVVLGTRRGSGAAGGRTGAEAGRRHAVHRAHGGAGEAPGLCLSQRRLLLRRPGRRQ